MTRKKAHFIGTLKSEEVRNNVFRVLERIGFYSSRLGVTFWIMAGLVCDFESCGKLRTSNEAGALHDQYYRYDSDPVLSRKVVDDLFYEALLADGNTSVALAYCKWLAVRALGWRYYHKQSIFDGV